VWCGVDHPPPSSAEVRERVELYLYCPPWAFTACSRVNFTFTFTMFVLFYSYIYLYLFCFADKEYKMEILKSMQHCRKPVGTTKNKSVFI